MSDALLRHLERQLEAAPDLPLLVAFSGGADSTALLHALASLSQARARGLQALHVDHGLHPDSGRWARHCAAVCARLELPLRLEEVRVEHIDELGVEAAARRARHAAFARHLAAPALVALAHHQDDQAETLLLRLMHGAGPEGLAGMRALRACAAGWLWRPCLQVPREWLRHYVAAQGLDWIEDPSNDEVAFTRNHLRLRTLPTLGARWPDATARIAAAAARLREESDALDGFAHETLARAQGVDPATLSVRELSTLRPALARRVVGLWLDRCALPRPPARVWSKLLPEFALASPQSAPMLAWRGVELRRYRDHIYAMAPLAEVDANWSQIWHGHEPLELPSAAGRLLLDPARELDRITVRWRRGGERLRQPGANRELRTLLQDLGVPPWVRARTPLLVRGDEILAAADFALAPDFAQELRSVGTRLRWEPTPARDEAAAAGI